jgi:hypothetical protein
VTTNQDSTVARQGVLFGTHERDTVLLGPLTDSRQAFREERNSGNEWITGLPVLVALRLGPPGPEFRTQKDVPDAGALNFRGKRFAIELGIPAAVRRGPDVGERRHAMPAEQIEEDSGRVVGVTDGEQAGLGDW